MVRTKLQQLKRHQDGISTEALGRAAQAGASVALPQSALRVSNGSRGSGGACFGAMRSDGKKDGSDPISTRRHFAERLDGTGKM